MKFKKKTIIIITCSLLAIAIGIALFCWHAKEGEVAKTESSSWRTKIKKHMQRKEYAKAAEFLESLLLESEQNKPKPNYYPQAISLFEVYYIQSRNIIESKEVNKDRVKRLQNKIKAFSRFGLPYLYLPYIYANQAKSFQLLENIEKSNELANAGLKSLETHSIESDGVKKVKMRLLWILAKNHYKNGNLSDAIKVGKEAFSLLEQVENTPSLRELSQKQLVEWQQQLNVHK